jgi:hypothetical protein
MRLSPTENEYNAVLRNDFPSFIERSFYELNPQTRLKWEPHIEVIATELESCRRGECIREIFCLEPRSLKSHCISIAYPAWYLGHQPSTKVICASHGQELADTFARDCRQIMLSEWYQRIFRTRLSDRQAVSDFHTTEGGGRLSTSVGGHLVGRGADLFIIDDPLKPQEAFSDTQRSEVNNWYDNTVVGRLNDKATSRIIITMQRLHQNDLVGHVLKKH